jgi:hypothetical protein
MMEERKEKFFFQLLLVGVGDGDWCAEYCNKKRYTCDVIMIVMDICIIPFLHGFFFEFFV